MVSMASTFDPKSEPIAEVMRRTLEKLDVHRCHQISGRQLAALNGLRFHDIVAHEAEDMVMHLSAYVWMEVLQDETVTAKFDCEYPADWWQHFKLRWFPAWALRRWPVRATKVHEEQSHRFRTVALLPEFKYEAPPNTGPYVIRTMAERRW